MRLSDFNQFSLRLWALPFLLFALTAPLWLHVWEPRMFLFLNSLLAAVPAPVWAGLSMLGNGWGVLGVTSPLLVWQPRLMWAWLCAAPFAIVFARLGKGLLESPRPAAVVEEAQMRIVGEVMHNVSMPSGHTTTAFAVAAAMYFALAPLQRRRHGWLLVLAVGAGLSRIAVGAHWPGDVAVGAALGLLAGLLGNVLLASVPARWLLAGSWALRLVAALVALALYHLLTEPLDFEENLPAQYGVALVAALSLAAFVRQTLRSVRP